MALLIEELGGLLKDMGPPTVSTPEIVKKYLDYLGDSMYLGLFGPRKVVISKSLLTYLDYDVEELAISAIKYRSLMFEYSFIKEG